MLRMASKLGVGMVVAALSLHVAAAQQAAVSLKDDDLDTVATFTTARPIPKDLYRIRNYEQVFIRAFVDKTTGSERYQLYAFVWYEGDWRNYASVNYQTMAGPAEGRLSAISRDVHDCSSNTCALSEDVAFDLNPALVRAWVATTDDAHLSWSFKLGAQRGGEDLREGIPRSELAAIVRAIDAYKAAHHLG